MSNKETCRQLEMLMEQESADDKTALNNLRTMKELLSLLTHYANKGSSENNNFVETVKCLRKNLPDNLIDTLLESEDLETCLCSIDLLHYLQLIVKSNGKLFGTEDILSSIQHVNKLLDSMHTIHSKFCNNKEYKTVFVDVHCKLLGLLNSSSKIKEHQKSNVKVSQHAVRFISYLINLQSKNKRLAGNLLQILKLVCCRKTNCDLIVSQKFFNAIASFSKITQKYLAATTVLKYMSAKNTLSLLHMCQNEKIFDLILEMIQYEGKKPVNKRILMVILGRITKSVYGAKYLLNPEKYQKLIKYFIRNDNYKNFQNRMATIKAYSILNRTVEKCIIPSQKFKIDVYLDKNSMNNVISESSDEESDIESDDSTYEDTSSVTSRDSIYSIENKFQNNDEDFDTKRNLQYYKELYLKDTISDKSSNVNITQLKETSFQNVTKSINNFQINKTKCFENLAYPDTLMLEEESLQHNLNISTNYFNASELARRLKFLKQKTSNFVLNTVYDLDKLLIEDPKLETFKSFMCNYTFQTIDSENLEFESRFESGNLRKALQTGELEYELLLNTDTNCNSGHQWFYFQISNMVPGVMYTFKIVNLTKVNSQHNYGMQPVLFSVKDYILEGIGWRRAGESIIYHENNYTDEFNRAQYYTLSFSLKFSYSNDYVFLAYHFPYTFTRLMNLLFPIGIDPENNEILTRVDRLCYTVNNRNEVPLLTITASSDYSNSSDIPLKKRPLVFITARVHPGETNASWIMEGIIKYLLSNTDQNVIQARKKLIFKIVPMLNPEGVIFGNSRCGIAGNDLNRCWKAPDIDAHPEIYFCKKLIEYAKNKLKHPVAAYIDIHGHSRKKFFFLYGCNPNLSWNAQDKTFEENVDVLKILPQTLREHNPHFKMTSCKYKVQKCKEGTGRVVMWRELGIKESYTLECSYCAGEDGKTVDTKMLTDIGASLIVSLGVLATNKHIC